MVVLHKITSSVLQRSVGLTNVSRLIFCSPLALVSSKEVIEKEKEHVATSYESLPVVINRGEGIYMYDMEGKRYFDFFGAFSTLNQGHCHPKIVATMREQVGILHHTARAIHHNLLYEVSDKLCSVLNFDKVLLTNTGVEGGETAVKLARIWGYKKKKIPAGQAGVIFAEGNFWGRTLAAISSSDNPVMYEGFQPLMPGYHKVPYNNIEKLEEKLKADPNICAFMVEPVQGEAGAVVPDPGYLKEVRRLCTKYNVLWIDDEVQAGLGRTGKMLAADHDGVKADIVVLGKALSGGVYPIAAVLADDPVMECFTPGTHGSTFGGNPLACKIAMTAIDVIMEEGMVENADKMGKIFRSELTKRLDKTRVTGVRGLGLLNAVLLNSDVLLAKTVAVELIKRGLVVKHSQEHILRISPALIITEEQLRAGIDIIVNTINTMPTKK